MSVASILKTKGNNVFTIRPDHSVADAAALLSGKKVGVAVVSDNNSSLLGVLSERDIVHSLSQYGKSALDMPVRNIMSSPVVTCAPTDSVKTILEVMTERRIRHLPVVAEGQLQGIVSIGDAVSHRLREAQLEVGVLRDFAVIR
jgi:CBS domain-containing protein